MVRIFSIVGPGLLLVLGILPMLGVVLIQRALERRHPRRSPLTKDMLRIPGHSLREKIADINIEIETAMVAVCVIPIAIYAMHVSQSYLGGMPETSIRTILSFLLATALTLLMGRKVLRLLEKRKQFVLGLEGELATAEELNQLMLHGCRVFHDIPFPYGNIDHVVVSPSGVYAVNTKIRGKLKEGHSAEVIVDHSADIIRFPSGDYIIPVDQLETEARWLAQFLRQATGEAVAIESILALPGWYIKQRIGRSSVYVINPHKPTRFFVQKRQVLSPELIERIAHQLDQRCRDVEVSYKGKREW